MKKLSILVVLLVALLNSFATANLLKNSSPNEDEYYTLGYYDKSKKEIVMTIEITSELSKAYNELSKAGTNLNATLNSIEIKDANPENMNDFAYFCAYGVNTESNSFNVATEVYKIEKDDRIYFCMKKNHGKVTHTCTGCRSCSFVYNSNNEITGCHCNESGGDCTHTIVEESGGGNGEALRGWVAIIISLISLL